MVEWNRIFRLFRFFQNFGMKFRKMSVPFASPPGISGIFWRMEIKAPCIFSCYDPISDCEVGFVPGFFPLLKGDGLIRSVTPWLLASRVLTLRMRCFILVAPSLCPKGTFLKTGLYCVPDCGPGSYGHTLTNTCQKCSSKCRTCRNGALDDLCTSCNPLFYLRGIRLCF